MFFGSLKPKPGLKKMGSSGNGLLFRSSDNLLPSGSQADSSIDPEVMLVVCFPPSETPVGITMTSSTPKGVPKTLVTVVGITEDSCASGLMVKGDTIIRINDEEPMDADHAGLLITAARSGGGECNIKVIRPRVQSVTLVRQPGQPYGLKLGREGAEILVTGLAPGGIAIKSGMLCKGCRLVKIDGGTIGTSSTASDVAAVIANGAFSVSLSVAHDSLADVDLLDSQLSLA